MCLGPRPVWVCRRSKAEGRKQPVTCVNRESHRPPKHREMHLTLLKVSYGERARSAPDLDLGPRPEKHRVRPPRLGLFKVHWG